MLRLFCLSAIALGIAGCGSDNKKPVIPVEPTVYQQAQGAWVQKGYGRYLQADSQGVRIFEANQAGCLPLMNVPMAQADSTFGDFSLPGANRLEFDLVEYGPYYRFVFERVDTLPSVCVDGTDESQDPVANFEYFWHKFNELYAFFALREVDWQAMYDRYRPLVNASTTDEQLFDIFTQMLEPLNDGHVVLSAQTLDRDYSPTSKTGQLFKQIEQAQVSAFMDDPSISEAQLDALQELYINEYIQRIRSYIVADSGGELGDSGMPGMIWGKTAQNVAILVVTRMYGFSGKGAPEDLAVLDEIMPEIMADLADTKGMIVDIRLNDGGFDPLGLKIASYLTNERRLAFTKQARNKHGNSPVGEFFIEPDGDIFYNKPVYLLVSEDTVSAGETFTLAMSALPQVTLVGQSTWGGLSDKLPGSLPNGWDAELSHEFYWDHLGRHFEKSGIPPDVYLPTYSLSGAQFGRFSSYDYVLTQLGGKLAPASSESELDNNIETILADANLVGASIAAIKQGHIVWQGNYGQADDSGRPVTLDTPFKLASVSKTFLGTALAHAQHELELDLSAPVQNWLDFPLQGVSQQASFAHLASHTSGITDASYLCAYYALDDSRSLYNELYASDSCPDPVETDLGRFLKSYLVPGGVLYQQDNYLQHPTFEPGMFSEYSNLATGLASYAFGRFLNQQGYVDYFDYTQQRLFTPLGMHNTSWDPALPDQATLYADLDGDGVNEPIPQYSGVTSADGELRSSARDLSRYLDAMMHQGKLGEQQVLNANAVKSALTDNPALFGQHGLFWEVDGSYIRHSGGDPGVSTEIIGDLQNDIALVILTTGGDLEGDASAQALVTIEQAVWQYLLGL